MRRIERLRILLVFWSAVFVLSGAAIAAEEGKLKVHKNLITVSEPDDKGIVKIAGGPGAIESSSPPTAWLIRLATKEMVNLTVNADGSFAGAIAAKAGEKVRVLAKNAQKKQSYGTFKVPGKAQAAPAPSEKDKEQPKTPESTPETPKEGEKDKPAEKEKSETPALDGEK